MRKKIWIPLVSILGLIGIPNGIILATSGIDGWQAFLATQNAMLEGLKVYFDALIELFKLVK